MGIYSGCSCLVLCIFREHCNPDCFCSTDAEGTVRASNLIVLPSVFSLTGSLCLFSHWFPLSSLSLVPSLFSLTGSLSLFPLYVSLTSFLSVVPQSSKDRFFVNFAQQHVSLSVSVCLSLSLFPPPAPHLPCPPPPPQLSLLPEVPQFPKDLFVICAFPSCTHQSDYLICLSLLSPGA